ncbi:helix-turn-helix domain-containing protein [Brevibacillus nitrificans]|uniref:Crp/Fnr family transcriptional regulator n=1 Tax=Brevibacillus nitrificans TaxID=651560 RepID=UPI0028595A53|nr:helix-turn-helix domain-containing protein [Brevibacillus nitrificans]MDR7316986.1 hypothetical protein [Brevibacillus nitrificans]
MKERTDKGLLHSLIAGSQLHLIFSEDILCEVRTRWNSFTLLVAISYKTLQERYLNHPPFLQFILQKISHKLYNSTSLNLLYPVENRFASYVLSTLSDESELHTGKLTEIADLLGTSYRHLNRVIRDLCAAHVIERKKGSLLIIDRDKIKQLANGSILVSFSIFLFVRDGEWQKIGEVNKVYLFGGVFGASSIPSAILAWKRSL